MCPAAKPLARAGPTAKPRECIQTQPLARAAQRERRIDWRRTPLQEDSQAFVDEVYVPWLQALLRECANAVQKVPAGLLSAIMAKYGNLEDASTALKGFVPWNAHGYVNFQATPSTS